MLQLQSQLRKKVNTTRHNIDGLRKVSQRTSSSSLWSKVMHKLKSLRKQLATLANELYETVYCKKGYYSLYGVMTECILVRENYFNSTDVRSLVDGRYYRVTNLDNKGYSLD